MGIEPATLFVYRMMLQLSPPARARKECRLSVGQEQSINRQLDEIKAQLQEIDTPQGLWGDYSKAQETEPAASFVPPC